MKAHKTMEEIDKKFADERAKLEMQNLIYSLLPDSLEVFEVFVHAGGYTANGSVKISGKTYPFDAPKPTADTVRELAKLFPPIPVSKHKGTFLTFVPDETFNQWSEKKRNEYTSNESIAPFTFKVEPASFSQSVELEWFSHVDGVGVLEVNVVFPLHSSKWLGESHVRYENYPGGRRVVGNSFTLADNAETVSDGVNEIASAKSMQPIRWAAGSDEHPGHFTVYWVPNSEQPVPLEAVARLIEGTA